MIRLLLAVVFAGLLAIEPAVAQNFQYPANQFQGFGNNYDRKNDFATGSPKKPDAPSGKNQEQHRAMSPDSWDNAIKSPRSDANNWASPATPDANTNKQDSASETRAFQSASFGNLRAQESLPNSPDIPKSILTSNRPRYPLTEESRDAIEGSAIQTMPAVNIPPAPQGESYHPDANWGSNTIDIEDPSSFAPNTAYQTDAPLVRNWGNGEQREKFGFEEKKREYPPMKEILATGRYFGSATLLYLKPAFQGNTAIAEAISGTSTPFDFDFEAAPQFRFGFESEYGPGLEFNYWQYDESSNPASFTSDGVESGTTSIWMHGPSRWSRLTAGNAGETLSAIHSIDVETFSMSFFKEIQFPISRLNGVFGYQYASINHELDANVTDASGTVVDSLRANSDMRGWGPLWMLEYYRPVGHTKFELMTRFGGSTIFGHQDQFVSNSTSGDQSRVGADEFTTIFDFMTGVQYKKFRGENRCVFCRVGYNFQTWLGGGTAILPQDDFGIRGWSFTFGFNR